jgi:hypothetical protein
MQVPCECRRIAGFGLALGVLTVFSLLGCASSSSPKAVDALYDAYETDRVAHYKAALGNLRDTDIDAAAATAIGRNQVINDLILIVDHNFAQIERSLYGHKAWADFGGSVAATGLSTAATLSGVEGIKTTLSALVTAIESTKTSFNKDILQGQGMIAILAHMHKARSEKLLDIRKSMKLTPELYPLSYALIDIFEYHQAGTFVVALQGMTEDAAARKKEADQSIKEEKSSATPPPRSTPAASPGHA